MVNPPTSFDSQHEDIIHDAQFDYYGKRLATCSSDHSIKVFDIDGDSQTLIDTLKGHTGPVWSISWSHPKYGSLIASASYDGRVFIWRDSGHGTYMKVHEHTKHSASVNCIAWAPHEYGLILATGSSDGYVTILHYNESTNEWNDTKRYLAHPIGVTALAWSPSSQAGVLFTNTNHKDSEMNDMNQQHKHQSKQLASAGCDNLIKIWHLDQMDKPISSLAAHEDWVRDVAFAPNVGIPATYLATCGQDKAVYIWTRQHDLEEFVMAKQLTFNEVAWRVSWSMAGDVLAVATGDNKVTLWRENVTGDWELVSTLEE